MNRLTAEPDSSVPVEEIAFNTSVQAVTQELKHYIITLKVTPPKNSTVFETRSNSSTNLIILPPPL